MAVPEVAAGIGVAAGEVAILRTKVAIPIIKGAITILTQVTPSLIISTVPLDLAILGWQWRAMVRPSNATIEPHTPETFGELYRKLTKRRYTEREGSWQVRIIQA